MKANTDWLTFEAPNEFSAGRLLEFLDAIKSRFPDYPLYAHDLEIANRRFSELSTHDDIAVRIFSSQLEHSQIDWGWIFGFSGHGSNEITELDTIKALIKKSVYTIQLADSGTLIFASRNQEIAEGVSEHFPGSLLKTCKFEEIGFFEV